MAIEFFVSHSHKDKKVAQALVNFLTFGVGVEAKEIRCTSYAATALSAGADIQQQLRRDLKRCNYFIPLITPNTESSEFVSFEIGAAWVLERRIVPVVYAKGHEPQLPAVLAGLVCSDLTNQESLVKLAGELAFDIFVASDRPTPTQMLAAANMFLANADA
jgi:hypothetical protein